MEDEDVTIRKRALDLITQMVSKRNLSAIVRRMVTHLGSAEGVYRNTVMGRIIDICSQKGFLYVEDFSWYVSTLMDLAQVRLLGWIPFLQFACLRARARARVLPRPPET